MSLAYTTKGKVENRVASTTTKIVNAKPNDYRPIRREGNMELWATFVNGVIVKEKWKRINYKHWY